MSLGGEPANKIGLHSVTVREDQGPLAVWNLALFSPLFVSGVGLFPVVRFQGGCSHSHWVMLYLCSGVTEMSSVTAVTAASSVWSRMWAGDPLLVQGPKGDPELLVLRWTRTRRPWGVREGEELEPEAVVAGCDLQVILKSGQGAGFCGKMPCCVETCCGVRPRGLPLPPVILSCTLLSLQGDSPSPWFYRRFGGQGAGPEADI